MAFGDPNEVRRMAGRGNGTRPAEVDTQVTGDAARDGFTRVAHREHPGKQHEGSDPNGPFPMFGYGPRRQGIQPEIGQRDYSAGPRLYEE